MIIAALAVSLFAGPLVVPGTGDSQDVLRNLAKAYMEANPGKQVEVPDSTGSGGGMESAGKGTTELGRVAVTPSADDEKKYGKLIYREFARAPVAFVAHAGVGVKALTSKQACDLFSGKITSWKAVGGPDLPVKVQKREGSNLKALQATVPCFKDLVFAADAKLNEKNADLVESIKSIEGAIGFMPLPEAKLHSYAPIKLDGKDASAAAYPVVIPLGFVYAKEPTGDAKAFVDFVTGKKGQEILTTSGHLLPKK